MNKRTILITATLLFLLLGTGMTLRLLMTIDIADPLGWAFFGGWTLSPYIAAAGVCYDLRNMPKQIATQFWASAAATCVGLYLMVNALYLHPDPQGGLAILIMPFFQEVVYLGVFGLANFVAARTRDKE